MLTTSHKPASVMGSSQQIQLAGHVCRSQAATTQALGKADHPGGRLTVRGCLPQTATQSSPPRGSVLVSHRMGFAVLSVLSSDEL